MIHAETGIVEDRAIVSRTTHLRCVLRPGAAIEVVPTRYTDVARWNEYEIRVRTEEPLDGLLLRRARQVAAEMRACRDVCRLVIHAGDPDDPLYEEEIR